jgi:tRNA-specific 2-thiouridylase
MPEAFQPGPIKDDEGRGLGYHQGIVNYTIGQRRGLGIALGSPHYVIRLEPETRTVVVGERLKVYGDELTIKDFNLSARSSLAEKIRVLAQIRYQMAPQPAWLESLDNFRFRLRFFEPQWAITPGQAAVCYLNDLVLGGGMIEEWVH